MHTFRVHSIRSGRAFCVRAMDESDLKTVLRKFYACTQYQIISY